MARNTIDAHGTILRDARDRYARRADAGAHGAFDAEVRGQGGSPRSEVTVRRAPAPAAVAALLGVTEQDQVLLRERQMFDGQRPVQLATTYIPAEVAEAAPQVAEQDTGVGGIISRMAETAYAQDGAVEDVEPRAAGAVEAEFFGVDEGTSLMEITHVGRTAEGKVVEVTVHTLAPGWKLRYSVPLG